MKQGCFSPRKELPASCPEQQQPAEQGGPGALQDPLAGRGVWVSSGERESSGVLPGKEVPHGVAGFRGSVAVQPANGRFDSCAASWCLGRPELNAPRAPHLAGAFSHSIPGAGCARGALAAAGGLCRREMGCLRVALPRKPSQPPSKLWRILAFPCRAPGEKIHSRL